MMFGSGSHPRLEPSLLKVATDLLRVKLKWFIKLFGRKNLIFYLLVNLVQDEFTG